MLPPYPGLIIKLEINSLNRLVICHAESFICATQGITIEKIITSQLSTGTFWEEDLDLFSLSGDGTIILQVGGTSIEKELETDESRQLVPNCLVAFSSTVNYEIKYIRGFHQPSYSNNGLRLVILKGPGKIIIQSLPLSWLAKKIYTVPND